MKKLILFEIELKCDIDLFGGYVAAKNASKAESLAKKVMLADYIVYWEEEGRIRTADEMAVDAEDTLAKKDLEKIFKDWMQELGNARLTKLIEVGKVIVP